MTADDNPEKGIKIPGLRWWLAGLLMCVTAINYIDRTCWGTVVVDKGFNAQFNFTNEQLGNILFTFALVYGLMQPFIGRLIDWMGTRRGLTFAVAFWSLATMAHAWVPQISSALGKWGFPLGIANAYFCFRLFRGLLGIGEAGNFPAVSKTISEWFAPRERTIAMGIINAGTSLGGTFAPVIAAYLIVRQGWPSVFIVTGAVGFAWIVLWLLLYQTPEKHRLITVRELQYLRDNIPPAPAVEQVKTQSVWLMIFALPAFWGLAFARFFSEPAWQFVSNWIPKYFQLQYNFELKTLAGFAVVSLVASDVGSIFGGFLSPMIRKHTGLDLMKSRLAAVSVGALLMMAMMFVPFVKSPYLVLLCISIGAFAHQSISATLMVLPADLFPSRAVATANGLSGCIGYIGGALFHKVVGRLFDMHYYLPLFVMMAFFDVIGIAILWIIVLKSRKIQLESEQ